MTSKRLTTALAVATSLMISGVSLGEPLTPDQLAERTIERRAVEAVNWGMPAVNFDLMVQAMLGAKGAFNQIAYSVDARGLLDYWAFTTVKHLGAGQFYLMAIRDKAGAGFDGSKDYRLIVPANAPASQYWSAVVYDRATHALVRNATRLSRSSQNSDLQKNADGSVDVYFGPTAPAGKQANWIQTNPEGKFEVLFRVYGPQKPLFDKTWMLPDIERVN